jgi:hypothetical protein
MRSSNASKLVFQATSLERGLKVVGCHQLHQVVGLRRIGQAAQADDPVLVVPGLLADQRAQEPAFRDAADRGVDSRDLAAVLLERMAVHQRGAAVHVQAGIRMRQGEHRFLDRGVRRLARHQEAPRNERAVVVLGRRLGPSGPQQRLIRERPLEADAVERLLRALGVRRFEQHGAEHQVGLVADRLSGVVFGLEAPGLIQLFDRVVLPAVLQQRDAEVVRGEARQALIAL